MAIGAWRWLKKGRIAVSVTPMFTAIAAAALGTGGDIATEVAALDVTYQAAVKRNDAETMDRILHDDFILVLGSGKVITRAALMAEARAGTYQYELQDEVPGTQKVRLFGNHTAVVTALLWSKGVANGKKFEHKLWFSDTYVRTPKGWRYAFAQASLPLPAD